MKYDYLVFSATTRGGISTVASLEYKKIRQRKYYATSDDEQKYIVLKIMIN
jgi:hypothetical protein